jgi:arabinogalactan oligomer/maltooligosaccharide transport system permease protein
MEETYLLNPKEPSFFDKIGKGIAGFFKKIPAKWTSFWRSFASFFKRYASYFKNGDWATKLSFLILGFGFFVHGEQAKQTKKDGTSVSFYRVQWLRGVSYLLLQVLFNVVFFFWGMPYLSKLSLQGLIEFHTVYNPDTMMNEQVGDNSFLILLYSILVLAFLVFFIVIYFRSVKGVYESEQLQKQGRHLATAKEDVKDLLDGKFYVSILALPILGIIVFTIIPIIFMVCIAFTNYDYAHMPPAHIFNWVGWANFGSIFAFNDPSEHFGYAFNQIFWWTIEWAFFATITCYLGGLLLALSINSKKTVAPKLWRTLFVVTIAVPQFVSLMLIRYFFYDTGVANTLLSKWGVVSWAKSIGWISTDYFPFFSDPTWIKWMVILVNMWVGIPYMMLITTGILMNIPSDLYESARIDGASPTRMFFSITMPYILQVTGPYLISSFVGNINNFNVIYLLTNAYKTSDTMLASVNASEADLLVTWLYKITTGNEIKYYMASVIGILIFLISTFFTLIAFNQTVKGNREEQFQ